jgi:hypothetical protein
MPKDTDKSYKPPTQPITTAATLTSAFKSATGAGATKNQQQHQESGGGDGSQNPVVEFSAMSPTEVPIWANAVVYRFFLALRESELYKNRMKAKMMERMNLKLQNNSFVV